MIHPPDTSLAVISGILICIGAGVSALEQLSQHRAFANTGIYSWESLRTLNLWSLKGPLSRVLDIAFEYPQVLTIFTVEFLLAVVLLCVFVSTGAAHLTAIAFLLGGVLASHLLGTVRCQFGLDGADQMRTLVLTGLLIFFTAPTRLLASAALFFIAAQAVISYMTAGFAKLISPTWRCGAAVAAILNARSYGDERTSKFLMSHRWASVLATRGTIVFECFFPLLVFGGSKACMILVATAVVFHLAIAATMGLNDFVWSFLAAQPSLLYASQFFRWH